MTSFNSDSKKYNIPSELEFPIYLYNSGKNYDAQKFFGVHSVIIDGNKKYIFRVLLTTILQTLAIALIPSLIDNNYDTFSIKALVIFIVLLIINIPLYFFGVWKSL
jgi:hypothetical protein